MFLPQFFVLVGWLVGLSVRRSTLKLWINSHESFETGSYGTKIVDWILSVLDTDSDPEIF